jgi:hypothetical protein
VYVLPMARAIHTVPNSFKASSFLPALQPFTMISHRMQPQQSATCKRVAAVDSLLRETGSLALCQFNFRVQQPDTALPCHLGVGHSATLIVTSADGAPCSCPRLLVLCTLPVGNTTGSAACQFLAHILSRCKLP